ncbi:MAG: ribonuclease P protein component [Candidatus Paceibacterota bacterium]|jgi:ribonuclease P protein component
MLPSKNRISKSEFTKVGQSGFLSHGLYFSLRIIPSPSVAEYKCSFVVSAKVAKKAVVRNLLRRHGYSIIKKLEQKIKKQTSYIFFAKKDSAQLSFSELEKEIIDVLVKSKCLQ